MNKIIIGDSSLTQSTQVRKMSPFFYQKATKFTDNNKKKKILTMKLAILQKSNS